MKILVVSDFHLGRGKFLKNGQLNILEDFFEDERFSEFCEYYSSGKYYWSDVHLVLAGDILNLIQIDHDGILSHIIDDNHVIKSIDAINNGHPKFFQALKKFANCPNKKITYVIGNHDIGLVFDKAKIHLRSMIHESMEIEIDVNIHGVHIEHGQKYEAINTVPNKLYIVDGPNGKKILNLPWGSLFCIFLVPLLKKDRPHIDKVRPMSKYVKWCLLHDTWFFFRTAAKVISYFVATNFDNYTKQNRNFKTSFSVMKQLTLYPKYSRKAKQLLKRMKDAHTVVMGHTHLQEWRKFPEGKHYFNTGTWNDIPSIDAGMHEHVHKLTYCIIEVDPKTNTFIKGSLSNWLGFWRPYREEVNSIQS